jgi:hypothetical protein
MRTAIAANPLGLNVHRDLTLIGGGVPNILR